MSFLPNRRFRELRDTESWGRHALTLSALLILSACTHTPVAVCPAIVEYTPGQQAEAADELLALPPGSILVQFMQDYGELRARLRECQ